MNTIFAKTDQLDRKWFVVDAKDQVLGKVAARVASVLRGKHKACFSPHQEVGDYVVIINADKFRVSGRKWTDKKYYRHSGYPGGITEETLEKVIKRKPTFPMERAIWGMLPNNRLGRKVYRNVKVYAGDTHPHVAQQPIPLVIE